MVLHPLRTIRRAVIGGAHVLVGLASSMMIGSPGNAAVSETATLNPPAQKRPAPRFVELCTIDPVPNGRGNGRRGGGGFGFTGPAEFYHDGRMTCYRAKAVMRFRLGYSRLEVHSCSGRLYRIAGYRDGGWDLVTLDAFTTQVVRRQRLR